MGCTRRGELRICVDHATETISFIDEPFAYSNQSAVSGPSSPSFYDTITVQPSLAEHLCTRLSTLATALCNAVRVIDRPGAMNELRASPPSSPNLSPQPTLNGAPSLCAKRSSHALSSSRS
jgi:translation initiation factor 3 subunit A